MPPRVVLDTNTLISSMLFSGHLAWLRKGWQNGQFTPLVNHDTASELIRVLTYPKFKLTAPQRELILAEFLPYAKVVTNSIKPKKLPKLDDKDDMKFLLLAISGKADVLVSGDSHILGIDQN